MCADTVRPSTRETRLPKFRSRRYKIGVDKGHLGQRRAVFAKCALSNSIFHRERPRVGQGFVNLTCKNPFEGISLQWMCKSL